MIDHDNLESYADPRDYDIQDSSDTGVAFYTALARETGAPILEIACGTGRVSIPIARLGLAVTGLDIVPGMLTQARRKSEGLPVRWVQGDGRDFDLNDRFRLIFLTGNAFQAFLTRADQEKLLRCARAHLQDDGLLAFETRNPRWRSLAPDQIDPRANWGQTGHQDLHAYLETRPEEAHWSTFQDARGHEVQITMTQRYDPVAQLLHWTSYWRWRADGRQQTRVTRIAVRFTFPQELNALLHYNGFTVARRYGDWDLSPLSGDSPSIIVVARKRR